jgi:hypothetical protein
MHDLYFHAWLICLGTSLFIQKNRQVLNPPIDANWVRIPCSVSHPDITVTLQKNDNVSDFTKNISFLSAYILLDNSI